MRYLIAIVLLFFLCTSSTTAADFTKGIEAFKKGDFRTAFQEFEPIAEQGYASAQYNLGVMYDNGFGVPKDDTKAFYW